MYPIDPLNITDFERNDFSLQSFFLFAVAVAGKPSGITAEKINSMVELFMESWVENPAYQEGHLDVPDGPLKHLIDLTTECIWWDDISPAGRNLRHIKLGKYKQWDKLLEWFGFEVRDANYFLRTATLEQLLEIPGVGDKTARFFLLHSRKCEEVVPLDTHILKFVGKTFSDCPKITPRGRAYNFWEERAKRLFKREIETNNYSSFAEVDLAIWKSGNLSH